MPAARKSRTPECGRRFVGCELKPSYWRTAVDNLRRMENQKAEPGLFELAWDAS